MKSLYRTRFHRNGTVTVWDVYLQQWGRMHAAAVSNQTLATLPDSERERIIRMRRTLWRGDEEGKR